MTNFKGTKGKWVVRKSQPDEIKSESGFSICDCWDMGVNEFPSEIEAYHNALLISKAPEMLEMLEKLVNTYELLGLSNEVKQLIKEATEL